MAVLTMAVGGYCTPDGGTDCDPQALPFAIAIGGTTYTSFVLNGNGTLTLGDTPADWSTLANTAPDLSAAVHTMPVFAPETDNTIFSRTNLLDPSGSDFPRHPKWAASVTTTSDSLTAYWFICSTAIFCGTDLSMLLFTMGRSPKIRFAIARRGACLDLRSATSGVDSSSIHFYYPAFAVSPDFETFPIDPTGTYGLIAGNCVVAIDGFAGESNLDVRPVGRGTRAGNLVDDAARFRGHGICAAAAPGT